ncbi:MAG TPA: DUF4304 domain-containing protein [Thermoanaerobaculia bacterium]|nr:DUF4304 domain-containing protein [Thermoanaerobaculia bacterium]
MSSAKDILIRDHLNPILAEAGFRRKNLVWNRLAGDFVHVIDIQQTRWKKDEVDSTFTLNVALTERHVFELSTGHELPAVVKEVDCALRRRIGALMGLNDHWWDLRPNTASAISLEVVECVRKYALPFFAEGSSLEALEMQLRDEFRGGLNRALSGLYLAITAHLLGKDAESEHILTEVAADFPAWAGRANEVRARVPSRLAGSERGS